MKKRLHMACFRSLVWACAILGLSTSLSGQGVVQWLSPVSDQLKLLAISPDSQLVAMGNHDGITLLNRISGKEVVTIPLEPRLQYHERALDFSPDSTSFAFLDETRSLHVYHIETKKSSLIFQGIDPDYQSVPIRFLPNGHQVAIGEYSTDEVEIRSLADGEIIQKIWAEGTTPRNGTIEFSKTGKRMAYAGGGRGHTIFVHVYDLDAKETSHVIQTSNDYGTADIAVSPDGALLATGASQFMKEAGQMVEIWSTDTGLKIGEIETRCEHLEFMDAGRFLAILSTPSPQNRKSLHDEVQYWRMSDMKLMSKLSLEFIGDNEATFQLAPDDSGIMIFTRRTKPSVDESGAFISIREGVLTSVSTPIMISSIDVRSEKILIQWTGGTGPFHLYSRIVNDRAWREVTGNIIQERNITINKPQSSDSSNRIYAVGQKR